MARLSAPAQYYDYNSAVFAINVHAVNFLNAFIGKSFLYGVEWTMCCDHCIARSCRSLSALDLLDHSANCCGVDVAIISRRTGFPCCGEKVRSLDFEKSHSAALLRIAFESTLNFWTVFSSSPKVSIFWTFCDLQHLWQSSSVD